MALPKRCRVLRALLSMTAAPAVSLLLSVIAAEAAVSSFTC